jgi:hypothetical protein
MTPTDSNLTGRRVLLLLLSILAFAILIRIICFRGYAGSDDGVYAELAHRIATGNFKIGETYTHVPAFPLRIGLLAPTALLFALVGPGQVAMVVYPFMLSLVGVVLVFLGARSCFGPRAGLIAAAIHSAVPGELFLSTMLLPDLAAALWANAGVFVLYWGSAWPAWRGRVICGILAGLLFGLSWLCKESIVCLFPFVVGYAIVLACRRRCTIVLTVIAALTFLVILTVESSVYYLHTHDFFYRIHETQRNYEVCKVLFFSEGGPYGWSPGCYASAVAKRVFLDGPRAIFVNPYLGFTTGAAGIAIVYGLFRRFRAFVFPALWFLSLATVLNFMSSTLQSYRPLVLYDRYLYPLLFPGVLLTAGLLDVLIAPRQLRRHEAYRERFFWGCLVAVPVACACLAGIVYGAVKTRDLSSAEQTIAHMLTPSDPIYSDRATAMTLRFFWGFPEKTQTKTFEELAGHDPPAGAHVVINKKRIDYARAAYKRHFPEFCDEIPESWLRRWSGRGVELYKVPDQDGER